jgi:hypothetical protein
MIKTFYREQGQNKVYFKAELKIRSMAYGSRVHEECLSWLSAFRLIWDHPAVAGLLGEDGHYSGNPVCRCRTEFMHSGESESGFTYTRKKKSLHPLWSKGCLFEIGREGELLVDKKPTGIFLGSELKAWGITFLGDELKNTRYLMVIGKPLGLDDCYLRAYALPDGEITSLPMITQKQMPNVLTAKSNLYCFGRHIFTVHDAKLDYFYFRPEVSALETVAILSDAPNQEKACCQNVIPPVVCDTNGRVYWQSDNGVYSFPIGYPRRVSWIHGGEKFAHIRIHTYRDRLFLYRLNRLNREYECVQCAFDEKATENDGILMSSFNKGSVRNVFFYQGNGELLYIKIPPNSYKASVIRRKQDSEQTVSSLVTDGCEDVFCDNGYCFVGVQYARKA